MKIFVSIMAAVLLGAVGGLMTTTFTGCTTMQNGTNVVQKIDIDKLAKGTQIAARGGTKYALMKYPETRGYFIVAASALDTFLVQSPDGQPADLAAALAALPVDDLKTAEAQLAIDTILSIYEVNFADAVKGQVASNEAADKLINALRKGIAEAMIAVPVPQGYKLAVPAPK